MSSAHGLNERQAGRHVRICGREVFDVSTPLFCERAPTQERVIMRPPK